MVVSPINRRALDFVAADQRRCFLTITRNKALLLDWRQTLPRLHTCAAWRGRHAALSVCFESRGYTGRMATILCVRGSTRMISSL